MLYFGINVFLTESSLITLPFLKTIGNVFLMIILPVIAGLSYKHWRPKSAAKVEKVLKYVSIVLLALVFSFAVLLNRDGDKSLLEYYAEIAPYVILLNVTGMIIGLLAGKLYRFKKDVLITLPIEVGIQNSTLAITLAISTSFLNTPLISVPATVYGLFTFFSALLFGFLVKKFVNN